MLIYLEYKNFIFYNIVIYAPYPMAKKMNYILGFCAINFSIIKIKI